MTSASEDEARKRRDDAAVALLMLSRERALRISLRSSLKRAEARAADDPRGATYALADDSAKILTAQRSATAAASGASAAARVGLATSAAVGLVAAHESRIAAKAEREAARIANGFERKLARWEDPHVAARAVRSQVDTAAATETADAIQDGRRLFLREHEDELADRFIQVWNATFDNTCEVCSALHGTTAPIGSSFGGYEPGSVHPRCRCFMSIQRIH